MSQAWITIAFTVADVDVPVLEDALVAAGAQSVSCHAAHATPLFHDPDATDTALWPLCVVQGLFASNCERAVVRHAVDASGIRYHATRCTELAERAWHTAWREHFKPICFGPGLWICPSWESPPPGRLCVILDPGMAFGTGAHATTALCLEWLAGARRVAGRRVLDYGCGSGVLAIVAACLGATAVSALDIDPDALAATCANAHRNNCHGVQICTPQELSPGPFDVVIANLLLAPLLELVPRFAALVKPGGELALAGVLSDQAEPLLSAYRRYFALDVTAVRDNWALLSGTRRDY